MDKFTVEEINLMCVFEGQDSDMVELAGQVLGKLENMSDAEFAKVALEAAEWLTQIFYSIIRHNVSVK